MAWLEVLRSNLPLWVVNSVVTILIAALTGGVAWGLRPVVVYLLGRLVPKWSSVGATAVQVLILAGGVALIMVTAGTGAVIALVAFAAVFLTGAIMGRPNWVTDRLATLQIQRRALYTVGDIVTVGADYTGRVTAIDNRFTHVESLEQGAVILPNTIVLRSPILVQPTGEDPASDLSPDVLSVVVDDGESYLILPSATGMMQPATESHMVETDGEQAVTDEREGATVGQDSALAVALPTAYSQVISLSPDGVSVLRKRTLLGKRTLSKLRTGKYG